MTSSDGDQTPFDASAIRRPDRMLLLYYFVISLPTLFAFPFFFIPLMIKYVTLQYRIDDEGVSMAWGFLFRREILLTYRRIQDIHVRRNILHRWFGLAAVGIQTASGTAGAEMTIEGILQFEELRDFLYTRMRGARQEASFQDSGPATTDESNEEEALRLLREIRDELRAARSGQERTR